jgi:superfamily I DNA/RNA helicase
VERAGAKGRPALVVHGVASFLADHCKSNQANLFWIMGCEDGHLPHADSTEEDERRLRYAGMTRTRHRPILSSAVKEGLASRFLEEAGLK